MVKLYLFFLVSIFFSCQSYSVNRSENSDKKLENIINYIDNEKYSKAKIEIEYLLLLDPLSNYAGDAQFYLSNCYFYLGDYVQAIAEYNKYLSRQDAKLGFVKESKYMLSKCYFNMSLDFNKDQTGTIIAIEKLQEFIEQSIMIDYIDEIEIMILDLRNKLAKKDFYTANLYVKLGEVDSANIYYVSIIDNYYDTDYVNHAIFNMAILYFVNVEDNLDLPQNNQKTAIEFLNKHKSNFLTINDYESTLSFIEDMNLDEEYDYYINLLK